ncbi:MAG: EamA family transporter [Candidatus Saccharimonadales bacterium]
MEIFYAWLASIASGLEPLGLKASTKSLIRNPWLFNILWLAGLLPFTIPFALYTGGGMPHDWVPLVGIAVCSAVFYALYTITLYKVDLSTIAPLFSLRTIFALLIGVYILHETISPLGWLLITVILIASPFAAYDEVFKFRAFRNRYLVLAVVVMTALAGIGYFVHLSYAVNGFATTLLWQDALALLLLLPALLYKSVRREKITPKKLLPFVLLGVIGLVYNTSTILAYGHNLAISSVIISLPLSMYFVWFASRRYSRLLEPHPPRVNRIRFTAATVMVACAIWLSLLY